MKVVVLGFDHHYPRMAFHALHLIEIPWLSLNFTGHHLQKEGLNRALMTHLQLPPPQSFNKSFNKILSE